MIEKLVFWFLMARENDLEAKTARISPTQSSLYPEVQTGSLTPAELT